MAERRPALELSTLDICYLAFLRYRADAESLAEFDELTLVDAFTTVCRSVEPAADNVNLRATRAIGRLREQGLLIRVDAAGVVRAGRFGLSRLGEAIVSNFVDEDALTTESLTVLTKTLSVTLESIREVAMAPSEVDWSTRVSAPLDIGAADLLEGILRRQRGLDQQQQAFQQEIGNLLRADWFGAVDQCQALLDTTARTLRELNEMLLRDTKPLQVVLAEVLERAHEAGAVDAVSSISRVIGRVDQITEWGASRQLAWSEYYDYVHRYLRDVVRLDPARAISHRLRALLAEGGRDIALTVAGAPPMTFLREVEAVQAPPPVRRPRRRETPLKEGEPPLDPMEELTWAVREELELGVTDLVELTRRLTAEAEPEAKFVLAGRIAQVLSQLRRPIHQRERKWQTVDGDLAVEQWAVAPKKGVSA